MARRRNAKRTRADWSCPLCTLINGWRDLRCAACDHERPDEENHAAESGDDARGQADDQPPRPPGVFFMSSDASMSWMLEPRLRVNRKRPLPASMAVAPMAPVRAPLQRVGSDLKREVKPDLEDVQQNTASKLQALDEGMETKAHGEGGYDEGGGNEEIPAAPTFTLLGFANSPPPTQDLPDEEEPDVKTQPDDLPPLAPSFNLLGAPTIDLTEGAHDDEPSDAPSVDSEVKLAQAGLRLSDSESEDEEVTRPRLKLRRADRAPTPVKDVPREKPPPNGTGTQWECHICTEMNDAHLDRCDLCDSRRENAVSNQDQYVQAPPKLIQCSICTSMNPDNLDRCELCETPFDLSRAPTDAPPRNHAPPPETVECPTCTNENPADSVRCELCDQLLGAKPTVTCAICTHVNPGHLRKCELCESNLPAANNTASNQVRIDLAASQPENVRPARERHYAYNDDDGEAEYDPRTGDAVYADYDDDFENPYALSPASPVRLSPRATHPRTNTFENVEDISDHEMYGATPSESRPPPKSKRPELQEFDHFRSVEDSRQDYQCQIDYRSMFTESGCSRSYADRLQKRRRESQKRKRAQAEKDRLGGVNESATSASPARGRGGGKKTKATKAPGGKKAKASSRRASTGRPSQKRQKTQASSARRSSAPSAFDTGSTNINHYDLSGGDFGDEVATMAWEGVGSAGYY